MYKICAIELLLLLPVAGFRFIVFRLHSATAVFLSFLVLLLLLLLFESKHKSKTVLFSHKGSPGFLFAMLVLLLFWCCFSLCAAHTDSDSIFTWVFFSVPLSLYSFFETTHSHFLCMLFIQSNCFEARAGTRVSDEKFPCSM